MSLAQAIPYHLRPRREKVFGDGRPRPLDRNAKARIMTRARALTHRTEKGKHYGRLTAKYLLCNDSRAGALRALDGRRGDQGARGNRPFDMGKPHRADQGALPGPVRPPGDALAGDPHQQRLPVPRSAACRKAGFLGLFFQHRISVRNLDSRLTFP